MAATVCELPSKMWDGLWDSLIFSDDTKSRLLDYIYATVLFSDADVDCEYYFVFRGSMLIPLYSQHCYLEPSSTLTRPTGNRQDVTLSRTRSEAIYPTVP